MAALGVSALTEGIKFLYGQAGELLKRRRERSKPNSAGPETPPCIAEPDTLPGADLSEPGGTAFIDRVRALLPGERLPAVAGLVAFAADLWPSNDQFQDLAASEGRGAQRVVTLLQLAGSPVLSNLVDPLELLAEAQRLPDDPFSRVEQDETLTRLFPILLTHRPPVALRLLHESVLNNWNRAMAQLEHAADPLVTTLDPHVIHRLTNAIHRALACVSPDDSTPPEIDGVQLGRTG